MHEPEKIGSVIKKTNNLAGRKRGRGIEDIRKNWMNIVGGAAGRNSKPTKVSRGTLYIVTRDDPWSAEMSMYSNQLLNKLQVTTGIRGIEKVRIKADKRAFKERIEPRGEELGKPGIESERQKADFDWEGTLPRDKEMREALVRFIRSNKENAH